MEALHAERGAGACGVVTGDIHQGGRFAKNVPSGEIGRGRSRARILRQELDGAPGDNVELIAFVSGQVNQVVLGKMLYLRKQADCFQLNEPERRTEREEVTLDHSYREARVMRGTAEPRKVPEFRGYLSKSAICR